MIKPTFGRFFGIIPLSVVTLVILLFHIFPGPAQSEGPGKVAVLPFTIHALQPLDHLKQGLQEMFATQLAKKGIPVINSQQVNKLPTAFLPVFQLEDIFDIGKKLGADWVMTGSLTQVGRKISIDLRVVDVSAVKPPFSVFMVEDDMDNLSEAAGKASSSVYNQIVGVTLIDSIRVEGNKRIESEAILAIVTSKKGDSLDMDRLDKDLRNVYKMGFFREVNLETEDGPSGKVVIVKVNEKPSISKIGFSGNKKIDDKDLRQESSIKQYSILNLNDIRQSIDRLKEFYRQKGYYNVEIKEKVEDLPNNDVSLLYEINEGEKVYVTQIRFIGNTKFKEKELKEIMETSEKGLLSWFTGSGLLDRKKLEFDLHKVTSFYQNHGYSKAKTGEPQITYEAGKGLAVTIQIIEGPPYSVNTVKITGATEDDLIMAADELLKKVNIMKEKLFNREVVRQDMITLRNLYADEGYAYADVAPIVKEDDENHQVNIVYNISKGEKVRFERINITGNTITRDKVIRRELKVLEGEYFSGKDMKKSTANLHRLGFFEDVEVQTKKGSQDDLMVLNVNVKEKPTGSFSMGAGYSSFENVIGIFQISQSNLFGYGQKLQLAAKLGGRTTQVDLRFTEPWFLDRPISAGIDLYKWKLEFDEYTRDSYGMALRFSFLLGLDDYTRWNIKYAYDDTDLTDIDTTAARIIRDQAGRHSSSSITLGISRDTRDKPFHTSTGSSNEFSFEYAGGVMGGDAAFNKYIASTAWYFPLPLKTVFLTRGSWGFIDDRPADGELPIYEKFRLGGINTVRGFKYATISPIDPESGDRIGGEKMMFYNLEYRFPLVKEQGVVGLVFFDAGNVFTKDDGYSFSGIRKSVGTGIRWLSPIGPIRIEYGKNLDPLEGESSGALEIGAGGTF